MKLASLIIRVFVFVLINQQAFACSCIGESTVESSFNGSDLVASGQVISITNEYLLDSASIKEMGEIGMKLEEIDKRLIGYYLKRVVIKVETVFKGQMTSDTLTIFTGIGNGDCGFRFKLDQKYVIYGDKNSYLLGGSNIPDFSKLKNIYWTNSCTRTQEYNLAEMEELEKYRK